MIHHRERGEVRRFDIFKLIILIILIALLLWFWLSPPSFIRGADSGDSDSPVVTNPDSDTDGDLPQIEAPSLNNPTPVTILEAGITSFSGSGTPGSTVRVLVDGVEIGTTEVDANGDWSFDLDLEAGSRDITFEALDADGEVASAARFTFNVAEPAAALEIPTLNFPDGDLFEGTVTLTGSGAPGSEVGIVIDDELVGTTRVGDDGTWSFDADLAAGNYGIHVQAIDADGNLAGETEGFGLLVSALMLPDFDQSSYEFTPGVVDFSGVGTPGTTIELVANGEVVGTAVVADDGTWAMPATLNAGDYDLSLRMLAAAGTLLAESEGSNATVAADFVPPTFDLPAADLASGNVTLTGTGIPGSEIEIVINGEVVGTATVADDGTWSFPATLPAGDYELSLRTVDGSGTAVETVPFSFSLAGDDTALALPTLDAPADGSAVASGELSFSGTGTPGTEVEILGGDEVIGTAVVGDDGTWSFSYTPEAGDHSYAVRNAGATETAASSSVTVAAPADDSEDAPVAATPAISCENAEPGIDQGDTYIVAVCEWLIKIANRLDIEYVDLIAVNPQIADPNLIYPRQVINLPPR